MSMTLGQNHLIHDPQVFVELRSSEEGHYVSARIEGASDWLPRTFVGVLGSRDEAISEVMSWAVGWLRRLREAQQALGAERRAQP